MDSYHVVIFDTSGAINNVWETLGKWSTMALETVCAVPNYKNLWKDVQCCIEDLQAVLLIRSISF